MRLGTTKVNLGVKLGAQLKALFLVLCILDCLMLLQRLLKSVQTFALFSTCHIFFDPDLLFSISVNHIPEKMDDGP